MPEPIRTCPLCGTSVPPRRVGVRGNREHFGADANATPHLWTNVVRCRECDYFFTDPPLPEGEALERAYYDDPERYAAFDPTAAPRVIAKRLAWLTERCARGALLDVGAGKGEFVQEALRAGWHAMGVEPSATFCDYARERLGVPLVHGLLGEVASIPKDSFDVVTLNHVLEHVAQPVQLLTTVARYLRSGGRVFVEVPNCDSYFLRAADLYFRTRGLQWSTRLSPLHPPFHRFGFTASSLRFALVEAGFKVVAERTFPGADRGFRGGSGPAAVFRALGAAALSWLPNRELLCAIASPESRGVR